MSEKRRSNPKIRAQLRADYLARVFRTAMKVRRGKLPIKDVNPEVKDDVVAEAARAPGRRP